MVKELREFDLKADESVETYKWSHDGCYLAKHFKRELEDGRTKEGITVYELPSMDTLKDSKGKATPITINGINEWCWAPRRNVLVYTANLDKSEEGEEVKAVAQEPRIGFTEIPSRQVLETYPFKGARRLSKVFHPQGNYLAVINEYKIKKNLQYGVEVFSLTDNYGIPHQHIHIERQVKEFRTVFWEPNHTKLAVHTLSKKESEGRREYTLNAERDGVDIYEMVVCAETKSFTVMKIGNHTSERVVDFVWCPGGDIFAACEKDGPGMNAKSIWSFYLIEKKVEQTQKAKPIKQIIRGKGGKHSEVAFSKINQMEAKEDVYEFKKTARHDAADAKTVGIWDEFGRFFVVYGVNKGFTRGKEMKSIKIYSIFGEPLLSHDKLSDLTQFQFRPRPKEILSKKKLAELKKTARKLYKEKYNEEEGKYREEVEADVNEKKKAIRDEFLNSFYLPLRRKYEQNIDQYIALWPLKDDQMAEEETTITHVYQYGDLLEKKEYV